MTMASRKLRFNSIAIFLLILSFACVKAAGPWCFSCTDAAFPSICPYVAQCGDHESCNTQKVISHNGGEFYTTTCKDTRFCHAKRRAPSRVTVCDECCSGTLCNEVGCNGTALRSPGRLYCLDCKFVKNPAFCDKVKICSVDEYCSVSLGSLYGQQLYNLGCRSKTSCPSPTATIAKDGSICCDSDLCNSNDLGQAPSLYTTTPIPTTRKPAAPQSNFDTTLLVYNITHAANETLQILCHVTGGPLPTVRWTYDNGTTQIDITAGVTVESNGDSLLSIPAPQKSNGGKYTCNATNTYGSDQSTIDVNVLEPPGITGKLNNSLMVNYQEDITLDCDVMTGNNTNVTWIVPKNVKSYTIHANHSITLHNAHSENEGDYLCIAENQDGKTVKMFSLGFNDTSSPQTTPQPCTCPTATVPSCPTVSQSCSCPTVTCPTIPAQSCPTVGQPCTCPKVTCPTVQTSPCPTVPPATPCPTQPTMPKVLTQKSTSSTTTSPTTTPTTSTTPTTPSTSTSTPSSTSTSPSASSASTPTTTLSTTPPTTKTNINTLPTANSKPMSPFSTLSPPTPHLQVHDQFQPEKRYLIIMQCPVTSSNKGEVTWQRMIQDFDHTNSAYLDNGYGILTISNQMTLLTTGVYECRLKNTTVAQFVIYEELSATVKCNEPFDTVTKTVGVVIRAKCGPCPKPAGVTSMPTLKPSDLICPSAIIHNHIQAYGGEVTYHIKSPNEVVLLDENSGPILVS